MKAKNIENQPDQGRLIYEDGTEISYRIIKSARKTMAVQITREGTTVVRIPEILSWQTGHAFAEENRVWIYTHGTRVRENLKRRNPFQWKEGEEVLFHGDTRRLHLEQNHEQSRIRVCDTGEYLLILGPMTGWIDSGEIIKEAVETWYRKQARTYLEEKTAWWAAYMRVSYERISIRNQVTRWGSCSALGNLNYNWKLVLLPEELADYVVVHELAHRHEMNHSQNFWKIVEKELPDYRQRKRRLQNYENKINQKY